MLSIRNLTKTFGHKKIIDDLSMDVPKGSICVLIGHSGVGKSTLLRVLNNLEKPNSGTVSLNKKRIDLKTINKTHTIGMVFQGFNLFDNFTVKENISFPLQQILGYSQRKAHSTAIDLLTKYGLESKACEYPSALSGGQKQRLAIARTLAMKPRVICMDEPTSALDPALTNFVANSIKELADEGFIVIVASHDTTLIEQLPATIHLMEAGKIIESGETKSVYSKPTKYPLLTKFIQGN